MKLLDRFVSMSANSDEPQITTLIVHDVATIPMSSACKRAEKLFAEGPQPVLKLEAARKPRLKSGTEVQRAQL